MRRIWLGLVVCLLAVCLTACSGDEKEAKKENLEFTVVSEDRLSDELKAILEEKKDTDFKITYSDQGYLYICVGYGKQETGGYSITVNELYMTDNAIYVDTNLIGPESRPEGTNSPSFPYIVLKIEHIDKTVVFD